MLWDLALMSVVPMVFVLIINKLQWGPVKKYFRTVNMALVPWCVVMPHYLWTKWLPIQIPLSLDQKIVAVFLISGFWALFKEEVFKSKGWLVAVIQNMALAALFYYFMKPLLQTMKAWQAALIVGGAAIVTSKVSAIMSKVNIESEWWLAPTMSLITLGGAGFYFFFSGSILLANLVFCLCSGLLIYSLLNIKNSNYMAFNCYFPLNLIALMLAAYFYYEIDPAAVTVLASPFVVFLLWSYLPLSVLPTRIAWISFVVLSGAPIAAAIYHVYRVGGPLY